MGLSARRAKLRKLLWKLFPPYEVKRTRVEARAFLSESAGSCRSMIEPAVLTLIEDAPKTVYSLRVDRMEPDQLALLLIANVVGAHLMSGKYHIDRGALGMVGSDMLAFWRSTQTTMLERGYATQIEVEEDNLWIRDQIKAVG